MENKKTTTKKRTTSKKNNKEIIDTGLAKDFIEQIIEQPVSKLNVTTDNNNNESIQSVLEPKIDPITIETVITEECQNDNNNEIDIVPEIDQLLDKESIDNNIEEQQESDQEVCETNLLEDIQFIHKPQSNLTVPSDAVTGHIIESHEEFLPMMDYSNVIENIEETVIDASNTDEVPEIEDQKDNKEQKTKWKYVRTAMGISYD